MPGNDQNQENSKSQSEGVMDEVDRANFLNGVSVSKEQVKDEEVRRAGLSRKVKTSIVPNSDIDPEYYVNLNK